MWMVFIWHVIVTSDGFLLTRQWNLGFNKGWKFMRNRGTFGLIVGQDWKFIQRNTTRCNGVSKFYYSIFIWSSTCFRRHTAHHQEPKTALAASGFTYVEGCWKCGCWALSASSNHMYMATHGTTTFHVRKTRGC
jgi:hypothetical protein